MSCHIWLSRNNCDDTFVLTKLIHDSTGLGFVVLVGAAFIVTSIRRWRLSDGFKATVSNIYDISAYPTIVAWVVYYIMSLANMENALWLKSFVYFAGYTIPTATVSVLIASLLQVEHKFNESFRKRSVTFMRWPPLLILLTASFLVIAATTAVTCGITSSPYFYNVSYPTYGGTVCVYFWCVIAILVIGCVKIKAHLQEARIFLGQEKLTGETLRVNSHINLILVIITGVLFPSSLGTVVIAIWPIWIDSHLWATELLHASYQMFACFYMMFWIVILWQEGTRAAARRAKKEFDGQGKELSYKSSIGSSTATNTSSLSQGTGQIER